jgi:hypothetical protein
MEGRGGSDAVDGEESFESLSRWRRSDQAGSRRKDQLGLQTRQTGMVIFVAPPETGSTDYSDSTEYIITLTLSWRGV